MAKQFRVRYFDIAEEQDAQIMEQFINDSCANGFEDIMIHGSASSSHIAVIASNEPPARRMSEKTVRDIVKAEIIQAFTKTFLGM